MTRLLKYVQAINEAFHQKMRDDENIIILGQGVNSPWYVGGTCEGLKERFSNRVIEAPISENGITGIAIGLALMGKRPIVVFPRMDFMLYACDQIINQAAKWNFMFGGAISVPIVFWGIINRGSSQGAQHSQDFTWLFSNVLGLKVVSPETAYQAKGMMIGAIENDNPVVFIDDRFRYHREDDVPEKIYSININDNSIGPKIRDLINCYPPTSKPLEDKYYELLEELKSYD